MNTPRQNPLASFRAFTIMEMLVSITILVLVILSVGVIFQSAGRTVGVSQASMEMLSNVRAIQQQMEADISGIDKNGFLVIRSGFAVDTTIPPTISRRCDQISFISRGSFTNRTGAYGANPFTDNNPVVPAAFIWWGQPAFEAPPSAGGASGSPLDPSVPLDASNLAAKVPLNQVPTGLKNPNGYLTESSFVLGRCPILLVPTAPSTDGTNTVAISPYTSAISVAGFPNYPAGANPTLAAIDWNNAANVAARSSESATDITQSRVAVAQCTPSQIMSFLMTGLANSGGRDANPRFEADHYCYRFAALRSPYDGTDSSGNPDIINGYFRMHPIALQGVSSFIVEWTDGGVYNSTDTDPVTGSTVTSAMIATTRWFGLGHPKGGTQTDGIIDPSGTIAGERHGDSYAAIFSYHNRSQWPVALRFRYHLADPTGRLPNGRDFVEVVKLPN